MMEAPTASRVLSLRPSLSFESSQVSTPSRRNSSDVSWPTTNVLGSRASPTPVTRSRRLSSTSVVMSMYASSMEALSTTAPKPTRTSITSFPASLYLVRSAFPLCSGTLTNTISGHCRENRI